MCIHFPIYIACFQYPPPPPPRSTHILTDLAQSGSARLIWLTTSVDTFPTCAPRPILNQSPIVYAFIWKKYNNGFPLRVTPPPPPHSNEQLSYQPITKTICESIVTFIYVSICLVISRLHILSFHQFGHGSLALSHLFMQSTHLSTDSLYNKSTCFR